MMVLHTEVDCEDIIREIDPKIIRVFVDKGRVICVGFHIKIIELVPHHRSGNLNTEQTNVVGVFMNK